MIDDQTKVVICVVVSIGAHAAVARGLASLPEVPPPPAPPPIVMVRIVEPPTPPPAPDPVTPEPTPEPKPVPKQVVHDKARQPAVAHDVEPKPAPVPDHAPTTTDTSNTPVFGTTMESTSQAGTGPAVPVGNTTRPTPAAPPASGPVKPLAEPVAAYEVTKMPLPQGRCAGKYTDEAKAAAVEGVVVLDIVVGEDGRARDIHVTSGLPHGLTDAAIAAVRECRFSPGEKNGTAVPVRVREFKIRFVLQTSD
jgi:TonB family protein